MVKKKFIMIASLLLISLLLLSACGDTASRPSSALPESFAPQIPASPSETQKAADVPAPTIRPVFDPGDRRPEQPFPKSSPPQVQFVSNELYAAYQEGDFVVTTDGFATNYQAWLRFFSQVKKGQDAAIRVFHSEAVEEDAGISRYQVMGRYYISVRDGKASWSDFQDRNIHANGPLSVSYDADKGLHEIYVGDTKALSFIYIPPDAAQIALYWGFAPLEELPPGYSAEDAMADGCLLIRDGFILNAEILSRYPSFSEEREGGSFLRVFTEDATGVTITDIGADWGETDGLGSYNEQVCVTSDRSRQNPAPEDDPVSIYCDSAYMKITYSSKGHSLVVHSDMGEGNLYVFRDVPVGYIR